MTEYEKAVEEIDTICRTLNAIAPHRCLYGAPDVITRTYTWLMKRLESACERLVLSGGA